MATSVWNEPEKNFWVTAIGSTINRKMQIPAPDPGTPGMFRCAEPGMVLDLFRIAGFKNISETEIEGKFKGGTAEVYWNCMTEIAAPFVAALGKADHAMKTVIKNEVFELVKQKFPDGKVEIDSSAFIVYGEK